jgi:hypothetical protein
LRQRKDAGGNNGYLFFMFDIVSVLLLEFIG